MPIIETQAGDVSAFVPHQCYFDHRRPDFPEADLFNAGVRPAINAGLSVSALAVRRRPRSSKLGGRSSCAGAISSWRLSQFASDLDEATRKQLERGERVTELMKQGQYSPLSVAEMAVSCLPPTKVIWTTSPLKSGQFEAALHGYMRSSQKALLDQINESGDFNDEIKGALDKALQDFKANHTW